MDPLFDIVVFLNALPDNALEIFAQGKKGLALKLVDPARILWILRQAGNLLLMSGTMQDADYIRKVWSIGRSEIEVIRLDLEDREDYEKVFPRANKQFVLDLNSTSRFASRDESTWQRYAQLIDRNFMARKKSALVCCFKPDEPILGDNKQIAQLDSGSKVIGKEGLTEVKQTFLHHYKGQMLSIKAVGLLPIHCTPEHPLLTVRSQTKYVDRKHGTMIVGFSEPTWKEVKGSSEEGKQKGWRLSPNSDPRWPR